MQRNYTIAFPWRQLLANYSHDLSVSGVRILPQNRPLRVKWYEVVRTTMQYRTTKGLLTQQYFIVDSEIFSTTIQKENILDVQWQQW